MPASSQLPPAIICLGFGKSAGLYVAATPPGTPALILTNHPVKTDYFAGALGLRPYQQGNSRAEMAQFVINHPQHQPVFIVTTNPERGKMWLETIMPRHAKRDSAGPVFFLPQSPNPYIADFAERGTVIIGDYYLGIGGMQHDFAARASYVKAGVKENLRYAVIGDEDKAAAVLKTLALGANTLKAQDPFQLALLPTNALLHSAGLLAHIAQVTDPSVLEARSTEDFSKRFSRLDIEEIESTTALKGVGFYRQMPQMAANILMREMSEVVSRIRQRLIGAKIMAETDLDAGGSFIEPHLISKYSSQFTAATGKNPNEITFGEFINTNPPYQNPLIVVPTNAADSLNTEHRFFSEELPTLAMLHRLGQSLDMPPAELAPIGDVLQLNQRICGREYLQQNGELGRYAPEYLRDLRSPRDFANLFNCTGRYQGR